MSNTKKELLTKDLILKEFDELWKIIFQAYTVFKTVGDPIKLEDLQHDEINSWLSNKLDTLLQSKDHEWKEKIEKIDHSIDVRYEPDLVEMFNKFIKKWCGDWYGHLIDSDENDAQFIRDRLEALTSSTKKEDV